MYTYIYIIYMCTCVYIYTMRFDACSCYYASNFLHIRLREIRDPRKVPVGLSDSTF